MRIAGLRNVPRVRPQILRTLAKRFPAARLLRRLLVCACAAAPYVATIAGAHDIPNQRVDRSIQVTVTPGRLGVDYEVSLSELTLTQDLRALIGTLPGAERSEWLARYGQVTGPLNAKGILVSVDGQPVSLRSDGYDLAVEEHPRYTYHFNAALPRAGRLVVHDTNYQSSEGTSRLAIRGREGIAITGDDQPADVEEIPMRPTFLLSDAEERRTKQLVVGFGPSGLPKAPANASASTAVQPGPALRQPGRRAGTGTGKSQRETGALQRISQLLDQGGRLPWFLVMMLAAGLGAAHAVQPGHGKTLVTAVALGPRAALYQPILLGLATTVAHMGSVLVIAAALWFTGATHVADLHRGLTKAAGFAIAAAGLWRLGRILGGYHEHASEELRSGDVTNLGVIGLGLAGGIVPCWDAVGLLVLAAAVGRLGAGVLLVVAFSLGMAAVLVVVGYLAWKLKSAAVGLDRNSHWQRRLGYAGALLLAIAGLFLFFQSQPVPQ